ncbi:helix-turn-helix domain-containing protein [Couchioplanes azureus]|uniref:helix-turn-helix domain-containing protein n=1 Tax=Couchioplanes caeruleus TaxID=56438 RepID=UPI001671556A|nr:helix-turn-helix transcriptional regulator [Couchioplanes caeruleus]GGQ70188.1 transcriptional regulator [Couchioplanes caeruleus subsp. azureus]
MVASSDGVLHRRRLIQQLRRARVVRGLTQVEVAQELDWSESKVLRIEQGQSSVSKTDLMAMLQLYGVTDRQLVDEFVETARRSRQPSWTREYADVATKPFLKYLDFEQLSSQLRSFELTYVPGLLQTEEYARAAIALHSASVTTDTEIARRVEMRMSRQHFTQAHEQMHFIIDEGALRRRVGVRSRGPRVMHDQLHKILAVTQRPAVTVQVLPLAAGEHPGMRLGSFVYLRFADPADRDLVFRESATGHTTEHVPVEEAWPYDKAFVQLQELALDPDASRAAIHAILRDLHEHDP